jgi:hypothetical protein
MRKWRGRAGEEKGGGKRGRREGEREEGRVTGCFRLSAATRAFTKKALHRN